MSWYGICALAAWFYDTTEPSAISMIRSVLPAKSGSCVTINKDVPSSWVSSLKMSKTMPAFLLSKLPVGSSPMMMVGSLINALAIATRCFCPPEICVAFLANWSSTPNNFNLFMASCSTSSLLFLPNFKPGIITFCNTVNSGNK